MVRSLSSLFSPNHQHPHPHWLFLTLSLSLSLSAIAYIYVVLSIAGALWGTRIKIISLDKKSER